jgi:hypothetical protein
MALLQQPLTKEMAKQMEHSLQVWRLKVLLHEEFATSPTALLPPWGDTWAPFPEQKSEQVSVQLPVRSVPQSAVLQADWSVHSRVVSPAKR